MAITYLGKGLYLLRIEVSISQKLSTIEVIQESTKVKYRCSTCQKHISSKTEILFILHCVEEIFD